MFDRWVAYLAFPAFTVLAFALVFLLPEIIRAVREHRERRESQAWFLARCPSQRRQAVGTVRESEGHFGSCA